MFKIYDGRDSFYQWDINRKLIVEDNTITQVHFCNRTDDCSLKCNVYKANGLYLVNVPNVLLQDDWRINVYGYDKEYTKHSKVFNVIARSRPEDYVYTEEDVKLWTDLQERVDQIEENGISDEGISNAINDYLAENPIEAPVVSVNGKTGAIELTAADIGALSEDVIIPDTSGLATKEYVDEVVSKIETEGVELSDYYTKTEVDELISNIDAPDAPDVDLSNYYTKTEVDKLIPSTSGLATEKYVDDAVANIKIPDVSGFALKTDIPDVSGFTTMAAVEAKGYQTAEQVNNLINTALGVIENGTY